MEVVMIRVLTPAFTWKVLKNIGQLIFRVKFDPPHISNIKQNLESIDLVDRSTLRRHGICPSLQM
jgi:hypothetical protein